MGNDKGEVKIGYADGVSLRDTCRDPVGAQKIQRDDIAYAKEKRGDENIAYAKRGHDQHLGRACMRIVVFCRFRNVSWS